MLVGACTQAGPLSLSDLRPFAAVSEAGCHAFLQVISGVMALYAAHLHAQQRVKPPATVPTASGTRTAHSVSSQSSGPGAEHMPDSSAGAPALHGNPTAVPPHHEALLQAVGLDIMQMQNRSA